MLRRLLVLMYVTSSLGIAKALSIEDVISPKSGIWANKQLLLVNTQAKEEVYYSFSGSDPLVSGFVYDEPIPLELEGKVTLKLASIDKEGARQDLSIDYEVRHSEGASGDILDFTASPLVAYVPGESLVLPKDYLAAFDYTSSSSTMEEYEPIESLSLSPECNTVHYLPLRLKAASGKEVDEDAIYRVVVKVSPMNKELSSKAWDGAPAIKEAAIVEELPPIKIDNWYSIQGTSELILYSIDGNAWQELVEPHNIARDTAHTIAYKPKYPDIAVPMGVYTIPPKPKLAPFTNDKGALVCNGASYRGLPYMFNSAKGYLPATEGKIDHLVLDAFSGECYQGELTLMATWQGVEQGLVTVPYNIDKSRAKAPVFMASVRGNYTRDDVTIDCVRQPSGTIYYTIQSIPTPLAALDAILEGDSANAALVNSFPPLPEAKDYAILKDKIVLKANASIIMSYRVAAYCLSASGDISPLTSYITTIDTLNYYLDPLSTKGATVANALVGTKATPFTTIEEALDSINKVEYSKLYILNDLDLTGANYIIEHNVKLIGLNEVRAPVKLNLSSAILVSSGAKLECANLVFSTQSAGEPILKLNGGELSLIDCELIGEYSTKGACLIEGESSTLSLKRSGLSISSLEYATCLSAYRCKVKIDSCSAHSIADTSVGFSLRGGSVELLDSVCRVTGQRCRILELKGVDLAIKQNSFIGKIQSKIALEALYIDDSCHVIALEANKVEGFTELLAPIAKGILRGEGSPSTIDKDLGD